jgi:hypothetical protein
MIAVTEPQIRLIPVELLGFVANNPPGSIV